MAAIDEATCGWCARDADQMRQDPKCPQRGDGIHQPVVPVSAIAAALDGLDEDASLVWEDAIDVVRRALLGTDEEGTDG